MQKQKQEPEQCWLTIPAFTESQYVAECAQSLTLKSVDML